MAQYGLRLGLGLGLVIIVLVISLIILLCTRGTRRSARIARFWILLPLATLVLVSAAGTGALASTVLDCILMRHCFDRPGGGYNRTSTAIQYFQLITSVHAFAAVWLTFWHSMKFTPITRHSAASHALLAFIFSIIPMGLGIKAVIIGLDGLNLAAVITSWVMFALLLLLVVSLAASPDHDKKVDNHTTHYAPPTTVVVQGPIPYQGHAPLQGQAPLQGHVYPHGAAYPRPV